MKRMSGTIKSILVCRTANKMMLGTRIPPGSMTFVFRGETNVMGPGTLQNRGFATERSSVEKEEHHYLKVHHEATEVIVRLSGKEIIVDHAFLERKLKDQHDEADEEETTKLSVSDWVEMEDKRFRSDSEIA